MWLFDTTEPTRYSPSRKRPYAVQGQRFSFSGLLVVREPVPPCTCVLRRLHRPIHEDDMPVPLTHITLPATYDYLCHFKPFLGWNLPNSDEVEFRVIKHMDYRGFCYPQTPRIEISYECVEHLDTLVRTMAHEMIHLRQHITKTDSRNPHNAEFNRIARSLCKQMGWEFGVF